MHTNGHQLSHVCKVFTLCEPYGILHAAMVKVLLGNVTRHV